jgi:hypothetical protein
VASKAENKDLYLAVYEAAKKALFWLCETSSQMGGGLGDFPGGRSHVEATCDGIDTILKFKQFIRAPEKMINFWS